MIDTISIEIDAQGYLSVGDFENVDTLKNTEQYKNNNLPHHQTTILFKWPEDIVVTGAYLPKVEYMDYPSPKGGGGHGRCYVYRITFSVPKLLYGNNISELSERQFEEVVRLLRTQLAFLNLPTDITEDDIKNGLVRRVDFGKNIIMPKATSAKLLGETLARAKHHHRSKYSQVQYRDGDLYRESIQKRAIIVYDKIAEYCNTKAKPISNLDKQIFELNKSKKIQVVRLEVQVQSTQQLKRELAMLGRKNLGAIKFRDVFSDTLSKQILTKYWQHITSSIATKPRAFSPRHLAEIFLSIASCTHRGGPQKVFAKTGFLILTHTCGIGRVRELYCEYFSSSSWARDSKSLNAKYENGIAHKTILHITEALEHMKPISAKEVINGR